MVERNTNTGLDTDIEKIKVVMIRDVNKEIPYFPLNKGYKFQYYQTGDRKAWAEIQVKVNHFENLEAAYKRFDNEFSDHLDLLKERLLFVVDDNGERIATAMMWFGCMEKNCKQRIHWIAVDPKHQGQRLTHAMLSELFTNYPLDEDVYLTTQTWSYRAISIYYRFGFIPYPYIDLNNYFHLNFKEIERADFESKELERAWNIIDSKII